ncbi:CARDB domain-containing protein [Marispirochaeta sp.]|uniref:CARDB domain-containing protein n=1 Tax=Marispirochaeta sp. TaxID=2038653 RepID=UPI0029C7E117|nr:CARDB domain-containing protein [Marispirochaeta sp.]
MKKSGIAIVLVYLAIAATLILTGCTGGGAGGGQVPYAPQSSLDDLIVDTDFSQNAYLDVAQSTIVNTSVDMEYSLDDGSTWNDCISNPQSVVLSVGTRVWIRNAGDSSSERFLGQVEAFSGPDINVGDELYIGIYDAENSTWNDVSSASPGNSLNIMAYIHNIGTDTCPSGHRFNFYISDDTNITTADTLIGSYVYSSVTAAGGTMSFVLTFQVPSSLSAGTYYIGCITDANNAVSEMNEGNNISAPEGVTPLIVKDNSAAPGGAVKIYNSWGEGNGWENNADGYYWMPYEVMKNNRMLVSYYYNDFTREYNPTSVLVFSLTHPERDKLRVTVGLGDPADPYMKKTFQSEWNSTNLLSGAVPFPANSMILDISEFASGINSYDLFFNVENSSTTAGSLGSLSLELYSDYDSPAIKTLNTVSTSLPVTLSANAETCVYLTTAGELTLAEQQQILPMTRSTSVSGIAFNERLPSSGEIARNIDRYGVYTPGKNYNTIIDGRFGTGYAPPSRTVWESTKILESIDTGTMRGTLPLSVDNSASIHFPPTGNQGLEGSCSAFSVGYYIQTYTEAKEHNWDLSSTSWTGGSTGSPSSNLDKIFSPDFIYHQINDGSDNGSNIIQAASLITRIGGATWNTMPYNTADSTSWPSEAAWREAPKYRGREPAKYYWDNLSAGYFVIEDDSGIQLLKSLLDAGYCVSTGIAANTVYDGLDVNDVVDAAVTWASTNHAQTVVGYKEGTSWDPSNPDS